jgi:hypothetical protein
MRQLPAKIGRRALRKTEGAVPAVVEPATSGTPFISFRYSFLRSFSSLLP